MTSGAPSKTRRGLARGVALVGLGIFVVLVLLIFTRPTIEVRWVTESELDVTGYNLYRGEADQGPFQQVNPSILPPAEDPFLGGEHTFRDDGVRLGRTYFYQLETVDRAGNRSRSTTIALRPQLRFVWPRPGVSGR